ALLGAYAFTRYREDRYASSHGPVESLTLCTPLHGDRRQSKLAAEAVDRAAIVAAAVHGTRDLVNTAPVDLFPAAFAELATKAARGTGVKVSVLDEKALEAGGYGGLLGVGKGSTRGPRLVRLSWTPS